MCASLKQAAFQQVCISLISAICALILWLNVDSWRSHEQFFLERDATLSFPSLESSVPTSTLSLTCVGAPVLLIVLSSLARYRCGIVFPTVAEQLGVEGINNRARQATRFATYYVLFDTIGLVQTVSITMCAYNGGKCFVGSLRPNFFAACDYKGYAKALASGDYSSYLAATVPGAVGDRRHCLQSSEEASLSFPSGHAALAFAGMTYVTLILRNLLSMRRDWRNHELGYSLGVQSRLDTPVENCPPLPKMISATDAASCIPLLYASFVACTRITDYKHRPADVIVGGLIGVFAALGCRPRDIDAWWLAPFGRRELDGRETRRTGEQNQVSG